MSTLVEEKQTELDVFNTLESEVRSYCRSFPTVFTKAKNEKMWDRTGREFIDFFAGAGTLNYGHNNPKIKQKLIDYILEDQVIHSLDMATQAKETFLNRFNRLILEPRNMSYKMMFPGPTGTNSVESALKLARKVTGRQLVMSFTNAFHGMTLGSLAVTGNKSKREGAGVPLPHTVRMPYDGYYGDHIDTIKVIEKYFEDEGSGVGIPAAIILETIQGEGGINAARLTWLKEIEKLCKRWDILLIVDDIQTGCGRTGTFFSFEQAQIKPDIICLSKSLGGYGLPFALTLFKPELDQWEPGEHNGTFRGNNLAFVAASEALDYWKDDSFTKEIQQKSHVVQSHLECMIKDHPKLTLKRKGRGLMQGISFTQDGMAEEVCAEAFEHGLIMETSGPKSEVAKVMPSLTIGQSSLEKGLAILSDALTTVAKRHGLNSLGGIAK